jgi:acetyl esterase/lipase
MKTIACPFSSAFVELLEAKDVQKGSVLVIPGGAYVWKSPRETFPVAEVFAAAGYQAAILEYTVGERLGKTPMKEAAWALSQLPRPVYVCGFSAGGHIAASLGVHWKDEGLAHPDGMILCYPVITTGQYAEMNTISRLGNSVQRDYFSLEKWVDASTPKTFLWHTAEDDTVDVHNSLIFANALANKNVPFELHIYQKGVHGLSLATKEVKEPKKRRFADPHVATWMPLCLEWLSYNDKVGHENVEE